MTEREWNFLDTHGNIFKGKIPLHYRRVQVLRARPSRIKGIFKRLFGRKFAKRIKMRRS